MQHIPHLLSLFSHTQHILFAKHIRIEHQLA